MFRATVFAAIGLVTVTGACAQPPNSKNSPTVGVYMEFESVPGGQSLTAMKREVDALLEPAGIKLNWRLSRENHGDEIFSRLVMLKFTGACRADWSVQNTPRDESVSVGDTQVVQGRVLPFSEVRCNVVRRALSFLAPAASREKRQEALGIALGRVVAHELYHVLARTTLHAEHGLAKASQPLKDLISEQGITFREQDAEAIRKGLESTTN